MTRRTASAVSLLWAVTLLLFPSFSSADIFKQTGADGVVSFTDTPVDNHARLILREPGGVSDRPKGGRKAVDRRSKEARIVSSVQAGEVSSRLPVEGVITSTAGWRNDPIDGLLRNHQGVDIAVPEGTPVKAIAGGRILFSGVSNGYGNTVVVEHEPGLISTYAHHILNCVSAGQKIGVNDVIALSGSTGRSTGPHLHFEVWRDGENITSSYLKKGTIFGLPSSPSAHAQDDLIRRIILADGSVLFTNLGIVQPEGR